jgi:hypothetical protein
MPLDDFDAHTVTYANQTSATDSQNVDVSAHSHKTLLTYNMVTEDFTIDQMENEQSDEYYCEKHNVTEPAYKGQVDEHCPYCRVEQNRRDYIRHEATRDPLVEPW